MFCWNCGNKCEDGANFCNICGAQLSESGDPGAQPAVQNNPAPAGVPAAEAESFSNVTVAEPQVEPVIQPRSAAAVKGPDLTEEEARRSGCFVIFIKKFFLFILYVSFFLLSFTFLVGGFMESSVINILLSVLQMGLAVSAILVRTGKLPGKDKKRHVLLFVIAFLLFFPIGIMFGENSAAIMAG